MNFLKISKSLREKSALIMEVDGELKDLSFEIKKFKSQNYYFKGTKVKVIRHDAAHIMAMAV